MSILQMSLSIPTPTHTLSSSSTLLPTPVHLFLTSKLTHLSLTATPFKPALIRMGGGPRTYPGGVSKWQWKRMQSKKAKQLLKARLARERQIYEMRKRAELKAAVSELERPWEVVAKAPTLFSAKADEQVKVLADRFQRAGGFDLWSEKDGPQVFGGEVDEVPSSRFFPKGVVHSIKPYAKFDDDFDGADELREMGNRPYANIDDSFNELGEMGVHRNGYNGKSSRRLRDVGGLARKELEGQPCEDGSGNGSKGKFRKKGNRRRFEVPNLSGSNGLDSERVGSDEEQSGRNGGVRDGGGKFSRGSGKKKFGGSEKEVFDMSLRKDGTYGIQTENWD
ncbi:hypothetical protein RJ640_014326 [Escallonia rubra]|uniref:DEAD-box ATP-dependent RNA helicase 48 n=1 Tax=Escallonia rubra TaxID=112253 RepID=A0AA88U5K6_9ASTE|nr:hypothetical protein RJ640_014326 [Escallonia rubra]